MRRIALPLFCLLFLLSCGEDITITPAKQKVFEVWNTFTAPLNYRVYTTKEDFLNDANVLHTLRINSGEKMYFPADGLPKNGNIFVYMYNDDYSGTGFGRPGIHIRAVSSDYDTNFIDIQCAPGYAHAYYYIDTNKKETKWHAVNKWVGPSNVWDTMNENAKYHHITINKASDFVYKYKDASGNVQTFESNVHLPTGDPDNNTCEMNINKDALIFYRISRKTYADPGKYMIRDSFMLLQIDEWLVGTFTLFVKD